MHKHTRFDGMSPSNALLFVMTLMLFGLLACEADKTTRPEKSDPQDGTTAMVVTFEQTTFVTSPTTTTAVGGAVAVGASPDGQKLRHYERTRREMRFHGNGKFSLAVEYLEGNSDIRIPMELHSRIKDRLHPSDPNIKPIVRFTIVEGRYTGFAADGSVVYTTQFSKTTRSNTTGTAGSSRIEFELPSVGERLAAFEQRGATITPLDPQHVVVEYQAISPNSATMRRREVFDLQKGVPIETQSFDRGGRLLSDQRTKFETVSGLPIPSVIITRVYGQGQTVWELQTMTVEKREKISVVRL